MTDLSPRLSRPSYDRSRLKARVLHIGFGAFAKAHTAVFQEHMLRRTESDWGMVVARLNSGKGGLSALDQEDHLFTVGEMSDDRLELLQVGAVVKTLHPLRDGSDALPDQIADPDLQVITLTITEKGYCLAGGHLDTANAGIAADLNSPQLPRTAIGVLVEGLRRRKVAGGSGLTILSCDNLPSNGRLCGTAVTEFAAKTDPDLAAWIAEHCRFPCSMVDRITPAMTDDSQADLARALGSNDPNGILCEPFRQWVIEDTFAGAKPDWNLGGASFVADVEPYEELKLRLLNGSHSFLAYLGAASDKATIADCMKDNTLQRAVHKLMLQEQVPTLTVPEGFDVVQYADTLIERFSNQALHHKTTQIASDGSQKLPQRLLAPISDNISARRSWQLSAYAVAGWMLYCQGQSEAGVDLPLNDPLTKQIKACATASGDRAYVTAMIGLENVVAEDLQNSSEFTENVLSAYQSLKTRGVLGALQDSL